MFKDKFKKFLPTKEGEEPSNKRKLENIVVFVVILVITIIVINVIWNGNDESKNEVPADSNKRLAEENFENNIVQGENTDDSKLVSDLENILSNINGVGQVKVMVTYSETSKVMPVYNEESTEENTEETDSEGGTRKVTQTDTRKEVIYEESDGNKSLITQSVVSPKVEGAIITAEGANDANVKNNIIEAVSAVTGLATHKIQVFKMSS